MAGSIPCDLCAEEPAQFMVGNLTNGDQQALGGNCWPRFCLEVAKATLPVEELAEVLGPIFVNLPGGEGEEAGKGRRGRKRAEEPAPEPVAEAEPASGPDEVEATAQDG